MKKRLSEKTSIVCLAGALVFTLNTTPFANAVGTSEKAKMVENQEVVYQVSHQPKKENDNLMESVVKLDKLTVFQETNKLKAINHPFVNIQPQQLTEQAKLHAQKLAKEEEAIKKQQEEVKARETNVQEERTIFLKMVKQRDVTRINLKTPSGLTADEIEKVLDGTHLAGLGQAFANAESKHGVNAYYLIAHAAWESGWGESRLAKTKNNLFGFSAYDADAYDSAKRFKTKADCVDHVAAYVSKHYLDENGDHYNGPNLKGMNKKYASDKEWANGIADCIVSLVNKNIKSNPETL